MAQGRNFVTALMVGTASISMIVAGTTVPAAAQAATGSYKIESQPLGQALMQLSRQANVDIVAPAKITRGRVAKAVAAESVEAALRQMLAGSGLSFKRAGSRYVIQSGNVSDAARGGAQGGNASGAANGGVQAGQGQAVLVGSVRDHKTGAALKGALVEVVETGEQDSTGGLGEFRFTRLPAGDVTLRVSYLGFPEQTEIVSVVGGLNNRTEIYLGSGATSEIVVIGQVSARAQSLNRERTAENNTTVISGDLLGNFNGTTIADSLRRAPGVAFQQNFNTGDGTNIIIRGLTPDYNQVSLNGVPLPAGVGVLGGIGRSPDLNNFLSDSVSEIKISKTLLANQDSAGTGGLVDIETKSPLDRPRRYFNVSANGTKRAKGFGKEYLVSGTASLRFGADDSFGISASVQYRDQDVSSYNYSTQSIFGAYLPLLPNGLPAQPGTLDPRTPFPFYDGAQYLVRAVSASLNSTRQRTQTTSISGEWQVSDATNLRLDLVRAHQREDRLTNSYSLGDARPSYVLRPIPALGGAMRYVYESNDLFIVPNSTIQYDPKQETNSDVASFRGMTTSGPLTLKYNMGYTRGSFLNPFSGGFSISNSFFYDRSYFSPEAINPDTGTLVTWFGPRSGHDVPAPLFTPEGFEALRNANTYLNAYSSATDQRGRSNNLRGDLSGKYEFGSDFLRYIEAGVEYRRSRSRSIQAGTLSYTPVLDASYRPAPLEDVGLVLKGLPFSTNSGQQVYRFPTEASIRDFIGRLDEYTAAGLLRRSQEDIEPLLAKQKTVEETKIAYVQGRVDIGKLEIIGGIRIDSTRVAISYVTANQVFDENFVLDTNFYNATRAINNDSDTLTSILPRVLANFRPSENVVIRAGYFSTVARPEVRQLNAQQFVTYYGARYYGPFGTQPELSIEEGNPGLKPARTHNFDVSGEWYDDRVGVIKVGAYYKRINNLLESSVIRGITDLGDFELPDHPVLNNLPADTFIVRRRPVNSENPATAWGVEVAFERQLTFLPGLLSGLGIYANYAYSDSKKTQQFSFFAPVFDAGGNVIDYVDTSYERSLPFSGSPKHSGTVGLTYTKNGFDGSLFYTTQARRLDGATDYGMDSYAEAVSSLDLRATYHFKLAGSDVRLAFEGRNLLDGKADPASEISIGGVAGRPKYYTSGGFLGGRKFSLGLSATF